MKFSKPLVLLLGSVLTASGIGCSAITAVVSDSRPVHRENRGNADRLVAIGRVFENQGRYDQAEVMYRKAQRFSPQDPSIRNQIQQLAQRRTEQRFGPSGAVSAIAMADTLRPTQPPVKPAADKVAPGRARLESVTAGRQVERPVPPPRSIEAYTAPEPGPAETLRSGSEPQVELVSASRQSGSHHDSDSITVDEVMIALENPDQYADLLMKALASGDGLETQSLAATLLGDCDPENTLVRDALNHQHDLQSPPDLLLAVCDSQIERGEASHATVNSLMGLCTGLSSEAQIQAAAQLRNFCETEHESLCVNTLVEMLGDEKPPVRATAAATLGDFSGLESSILTRLQELAGDDSSANVREAADSALARQRNSQQPLRISPRS